MTEGEAMDLAEAGRATALAAIEAQDQATEAAALAAMAHIEQTRSEVLDAIVAISGQHQRLSIGQPSEPALVPHGLGLRHLKTTVSHHLITLAGVLRRDLQMAVRAAHEAGGTMADKAVRAAGVPAEHLVPRRIREAAPPFTSEALLGVLEEYSADLITGITEEVRRRVNGILARAALGQLSAYDAIQRIAAALPNSSVFNTMMSRAETIYRTEVNRAFSMAGFDRMGEMAQSLPGLKKSWVAVNDQRTRPTHFTSGEAFLSSGSPTIVPWNKAFTVGGERAMYPRDPSLSAGESCNCRCWSTPFVDSEVLASIGVTL